MSKEKWMCWGSLGVAGVLLLLFLLDLISSFTEAGFAPFGGISPTVDILAIIACLILGYLAWDTLRELL